MECHMKEVKQQLHDMKLEIKKQNNCMQTKLQEGAKELQIRSPKQMRAAAIISKVVRGQGFTELF